MAVAKAASAENRLVGVRMAVVAFNLAIYWAVLDRTGHREGLALAVTLVASLYAVVVLSLNPVQRAAVLRRSWATVVGDSVLVALWLYATGGIASLFYPLWAVSLVAVSFRFGARSTAVATVVYALLDASVVVAGAGSLAAALALWPVAAVRIAYIGFVGLLGMLVAHETSNLVRRRLEVEEERRHWRREEERLRSLTDAAMEGIVLHHRGIIVDANPSYADLVGASLEGLRGRPESVLRGRLDPGPFELEFPRPDADLRVLRVQQRSIEYRDNKILVAAVRDVTEERRAEQDRRRTHEQSLEIRRLQEIDRFKTDFINNAAHELNTPLTPLKLQLHLLRRSGNESIGNAVDILDRNLTRLGSLVQDMLDIARLESGRLRIHSEPMDLAQGVWDVVDTYQEDAQARGVSLEAEPLAGTLVQADPDRVGQILHNLVSNALKFTPAGGSVFVDVRPGDGGVCLTVRDTGVGLTHEQRDQLFRPFSRVHEDPTHHGTGLGLYISHNLTEAMGGRIWCASDGPGQGTSFHVLLPAAASRPVEEAEAVVDAVPAPDAQRP